MTTKEKQKNITMSEQFQNTIEQSSKQREIWKP